jgi:hypothetical protein
MPLKTILEQSDCSSIAHEWLVTAESCSGLTDCLTLMARSIEPPGSSTPLNADFLEFRSPSIQLCLLLGQSLNRQQSLSFQSWQFSKSRQLGHSPELMLSELAIAPSN